MYKYFNRLHPKYINDMFNVKEILYSMRDDLKFILPKFNTKTYGNTQRRVQPDECYFTVQITGIKFECSL